MQRQILAGDLVADKIGKKFEFDGLPKEFLHPNLAAHAEMGKILYDELLNGEHPAPFRVQARAIFKNPETLTSLLVIGSFIDLGTDPKAA